MKKVTKNQVPETPDAGWDCPFRELQIKIVEPPPAPAPAPVTKPEKEKSKLSSEDQELLKAFSGGEELPELPDSESISRPVARGYQLRFTVQRKGKGGKTVTHVQGLKALDIPEQMAICSEIRTALGTGARFLEGILELQGDQRARAAKWFTEKGFPCP